MGVELTLVTPEEAPLRPCSRKAQLRTLNQMFARR